MTEQRNSLLTADECKRIRIALIFGDPSLEGQPDPKLEVAKAKLRAIEFRKPDQNSLVSTSGRV